MTKLILTLGVVVATNLAGEAAQSAAVQGPVVVYGEPQPAATRHVSYADLDLATGAGERTLIRRVRTAVNQVCAEEVGPSALLYVTTSCRKLTWNDTEPQLDRAMRAARQMAASNGSSVSAAVIVVSAAR